MRRNCIGMNIDVDDLNELMSRCLEEGFSYLLLIDTGVAVLGNFFKTVREAEETVEFLSYKGVYVELHNCKISLEKEILLEVRKFEDIPNCFVAGKFTGFKMNNTKYVIGKNFVLSNDFSEFEEEILFNERKYQIEEHGERIFKDLDIGIIQSIY